MIPAVTATTSFPPNLCQSYSNPALTAKMAANLQWLSGHQWTLYTYRENHVIILKERLIDGSREL